MSSSENDDDIYSDQIDSDLEAELYGLIHHERTEEGQNLCLENTNESGCNVLNDENNYKNFSISNKNEFLCFEICKEPVSFESNNSLNASGIESSSFTLTPQVNLNSESEIFGSSSKLAAFNGSGKRTHELENTDFINVASKKVCKNSFSDNSPRIKLEENVGKEVNKTLCISESDSDESIIFCDFNKDVDFKTNVDTIELSSEEISSDSDSELFSFQRKTSMLNSESHKSGTDPWYINNEDLYRSKSTSNRYHDKFTLKCTNCDERGHVARSCHMPKKRKCFICGGSHYGGACPNRICPRCYKRGHNITRCFQHVLFCSHCGMYSHSENNCPDIWRKYHLTTKNFNLIQGKLLQQDTPIYCFNCGVEGHFGPECLNLKKINYEDACSTWPMVISYKNFLKLPKVNEEFKNNVDKKLRITQEKDQMMEQKRKLLRAAEKRSRKQYRNLKKLQTLSQCGNPKFAKESNFPRSPRTFNANSSQSNPGEISKLANQCIFPGVPQNYSANRKQVNINSVWPNMVPIVYPLTIQQNPLTIQQNPLPIQQNQFTIQQNQFTMQQNQLTMQQNQLTIQQKPLTTQQRMDLKRWNKFQRRKFARKQKQKMNSKLNQFQG